MRFTQFLIGNNTRQVVDKSCKSVAPRSRLVIQPAAAAQLVFTGTEISSQSTQAVVAAGLLLFSGADTRGQATQTVAAAGKLIFAGAELKAQAAQTVSSAGKLILTGAEAKSQASQIASAAGKLIFSGTESVAQARQSVLASEQETFLAQGSFAQLTQSAVAAGALKFAGAAVLRQSQLVTGAGKQTFLSSSSTSQAPQSAQGFEQIPSVDGTADVSQAGQLVIATASTFTAEEPELPVYAMSGHRRAREKNSKPLASFTPLVGSYKGASQRSQLEAIGVFTPLPQFAGAHASRQASQSLASAAHFVDLDLEAATILMWASL